MTQRFTPRSPLVARAVALGWVLGLGAVTSVGAGCRHGGNIDLSEPDAVTAEIARLERILERDPDDDDARRDLGHLYWLHRGDIEHARPHLAQLAKKGDPVSATSLVVIAHAHGDAEAVFEHASAVLHTAASTAGKTERRQGLEFALAEVVVRYLDDVQDEVRDGDARTLALLSKLDRKVMPAEVRQPVESLEAGIERRHGEDFRDNYERQGCVRDWALGEVEGTLGQLELSLRQTDVDGFKLDDGAHWAALSCVVRVWNPTPRAGMRRLRAELDVPGKVLALDVAGEEPLRVYVDGHEVVRTDRVDRWSPRHNLVELDVAPGKHLVELRTAIPGSNAWVLLRATDGKGNPVPSRGAAEVAVAQPAFDGAEDHVRARHATWPEIPGQASPDAEVGAEAGQKARRRARSRQRATGPVAGPIYAPLRRYYALDDALADGDTDRAETLAAELLDARFGEAHVLLADFERADPTRGRGASGAREQQRLEQALVIDPSLERARLRRLRQDLGRGSVAEVIAALEGMPADRLDSLDGQLLRFEAYLERGSEVQAEAALTQAAKINPDACDLIVARRRLAQRRNQVKREDALTAELAACAGTTGARAKLAETRGRLDDATELWNRRLERTPDDLDAMEALARVAINDGKPGRAEELYREILDFAPFRSTAAVALADLLARQGKRDEARAMVREAIEQIPHNSRLREIGETVGIPDDLMTRRADGMAALKRYQAELEAGEVNYEGAPEVFVLDRDIARVYDNGGVRHVIHQVVHMTSKESLDRYGEVPEPAGGSFLTLHSIKPDGTVVEPESIAGKDGLSLRKLEVGDYIELEYMLDVDPTGLMPDYVELARFRFQDLTTPYHYSELVVVHPEGMPMRYERRNPTAGGAPAVTKTSEQGLTQLRFLAERMPRLGPEPQSRSMVDELPMVRVFTELDVPMWLRTVQIQLEPAQRSNPELRAKTDALVSGSGTQREAVERLWGWVMENVEDAGDMTAPATSTLAARQGNRLMLLRAMLQHLGIRNEMWLARDRFGTEILANGHPSVESFEAPMLAVWPDDAKDPLMVLTTSKVMPLGYLTPGFSQSDALRVALAPGDPDPGRVQLPEQPERFRDLRRYDLRVEVDKEGDGEVSGTIELQGMEAVIWRDALTKFDRDRLPEVFQQAELQIIARGAMLDLDEVEIENEDALEKPLRLRFSASASGLGVRQGNELVMPASLVSMNLGQGYTRLPERWSGMVVPYSPRAEARIEVVARDGVVKSVPGDRDLDDVRGRFIRKAVDGGAGKNSVVIESQGQLQLGFVEADEYAEFGAFTRDVAQAEQEVLRIQ